CSRAAYRGENMARLLSRDFRVGEVLGVTFGSFFANLVPFGSLALLVYVPILVLDLLIVDVSDAQQLVAQVFSASMVVVIILQILLGYVLNAALVYGTILDLRGQRLTIGQCISRGLAVAFPTLGVAIVSFVLMIIGVALLIVPGLIVMVMLSVAIPVAVIERPGVFA